MRYKILVLVFLLSGFAIQAHAQMTNSQVVESVKQGVNSGKSEAQIGQELLTRGVTKSQVEQLQMYKANQAGGAQTADPSLGRQRNVDDESSLAGKGGRTAVNSSTDDSSLRTSKIFGHNIFNGRTLTFEPNENMATPENYRLGPGDEVIIDIWGANEDVIRQKISPEGNILVTQIGPVYLNGITIKEANEKIRKIFANKYAGVSGEEPMSELRLTLGQIRTIQINVMGEVVTPGTYRLSAFASVFHALYNTGGVTNIGSLRDIRVMRSGKEFARLDVYNYIFQGKLNDDVRLQEGDVIVVPPYKQLVNIAGNVKRPMYYEMKAEESLQSLIDYAGGFTGNAYTEEVSLVRETGRERQLFNIRKVDYPAYQLEDGDLVTVGATLDRFANRVEVWGAVYRPGMYELGSEMNTISQLLARADGVKGDAFLPRVQLFRERENLTLEVIAVDLKSVIEGTSPDIALQRNDVLVIPSIQELNEGGGFAINGQIAHPGAYPYAANTTLEDLIIQAGGLLDGASMVKVEISRRLKDPKSTVPSSELSKIYSFSLKDGFVIDGTPGFVLEPFDVIEIRKSPGYQTQRQVMVGGEVVFSGGYTLIKKNERISDVVARAGGVTKDAYIRGGRLVRQMNDEERAVREVALKIAQEKRGGDSIAVPKMQLSTYYTVGIELDKALANPGSDYDMVLRQGDRLVVPEYVSTVKVNGDVLYPNTVLYLEGKNLKYYVSLAGGYDNRAKKNKAYIVYMNGTVRRASQRKARIEPGCEIVIPSKRERRKMGVAEILGLTTSAASVGTMAASIANLTK